MNFKINHIYPIRSKRKKKLMKITSIFFLFILLISFINLNFLFKDFNQNEPKTFPNVDQNNLQTPKNALDYDLIKNPFTSKFENMSRFFFTNYNNSILDYNVTLFYSEGDKEGNILTDSIYSKDNMLLYNSFFKGEISPTYILVLFKNWLFTPLYFNGNKSNYKYGFVKSINGTTGNVINDDRYLMDNLYPIFLFSENFDDQQLESIKLSGKNALDYATDIFELVNSSEFLDGTNFGFYKTNSSISGEKYAFDNLFATLALLEMYKWDTLDETLKNRALELANMTLSKVMENLWDTSADGLMNYATKTWGSGGTGSGYKYLDVNALGITTLLEYWKLTSLNKSSTYFQNATVLFDLIDNNLWNSTYRAYEFERDPTWNTPLDVTSRRIDLEANSYMMSACLDLFELTGDFKYYNRALTLFDTFESEFYDKNVYAYNKSVGSIKDDNKNLGSNAQLSISYLDASALYQKTDINSAFNVSESTPDFIVNQDTLELKSNYTMNLFNDNVFNITAADITYIFRYPNDTIFKTQEEEIKTNKTEGYLPEITKIICTNDTHGDLNGTYFNLTTPLQKYYVWFNLSASGGPDPGSTFSDRQEIQINTVEVNDTKEEVAIELRSVLDAFQGGDIFDVARNSENLTITFGEPGVTEDAVDGVGTSATNFTIFVTQQGENKTVYDHTLKLPIDENLPLSNEFAENREQGKPYSISIYANKSFFKIAFNKVYFNIISGLNNKSIIGIDELENFYQGQSINITLPIESIRTSNLTLNVSLTGEDIEPISKEVKLIAGDRANPEETNLQLNITAYFDAFVGSHELNFEFRRNGYIYLKVVKYIEIESALKFSNLLYQKEVVAGEEMEISFNLENLLRNNTQSFNLSYIGEHVENDKNSYILNKKEIRYFTKNLKVLENINDNSIDINMSISKGNTKIISRKIEVSIVQGIEIIDTSFPEKCAQGKSFVFSISLQNNYKDSQPLTLYINGKESQGNIAKLTSGMNKLEKEIVSTINPYEFGSKSYKIELKDKEGNIILTTHIQIEITLSTMNLVLFYLIPLIAPIGIILYYKNKDIKTKLLRR